MCSRSRRNPNQRFNPFDSSRLISPNLDELRLLPQRGREGGVRLTSIRLSSHRISKNKEIPLSPLSEEWKIGSKRCSVRKDDFFFFFAKRPLSCPVLSYPVFSGIILFSLIIIFCKRKRVRGKKKRKGFFSDSKRVHGWANRRGDRTEAAVIDGKAAESIERIGLTTIETQSGGCRVKRGWSRRMEEGRADGLGIYHFVAKVA